MGKLNTEKDEALLELVKQGNIEAEEVLIERYSALVRACARPLFLAGGDSEDLIQEGMFGLISAMRNYKPDSGAAFRTYAEHCIKNRLHSAVRAAGRMKHKPLNDSISIETDLDSVGSAPNPEELVITKEAMEEIMGEIYNGLSSLEKEVLGYYLDGLSYNDISSKLGRPVKSIDNTVQRIRKKVARLLNLGDFSIS